MSNHSEKPHAVVITEEFITNSSKIDVYTRTWEPENVKPRAHVVFIHGQAEHINRYDPMFSEFAKIGLKVHSFDQVGCGKTGVKANDLGGAMGLKQVLLDTDDAIDRIHDSSIPIFLMGHSFGGASALNYLAIGNRRELLAGSLISAPCVEVAKESSPHVIIRTFINLLAPLFPRVKFTATVDSKRISRDESAVQKYRDDPMVFSRCNLVQIRDLFYEGLELLAGRYKNIKIPLLYISHGTGDHITSFSATQELVDKLKAYGKCSDVEFKEYPGAYHELHHDTNRDEVIAAYCDWFSKHT